MEQVHWAHRGPQCVDGIAAYSDLGLRYGSLPNRPLPDKSLPPQPVDATPSRPLISQYFPLGINLYGGIQSEPIQGFCFV
jgi:hypothetical protein